MSLRPEAGRFPMDRWTELGERSSLHQLHDLPQRRHPLVASVPAADLTVAHVLLQRLTRAEHPLLQRGGSRTPPAALVELLVEHHDDGNRARRASEVRVHE